MFRALGRAADAGWAGGGGDLCGYPERIVPKPEHAAELKKRTLTNLYNARPAWLEHAHQALDTAVASAYRWEDYRAEMPETEILRRLLRLNLARSIKAE